jgi:hypothetical protein
MPLSRSNRGNHSASAHFYDDPVNLGGLRPLPRPCIPSTVSWIGPRGRSSVTASTRSKLDEIVASFATLEDPRSRVARSIIEQPGHEAFNSLDPRGEWERIKACFGEEKCSGGEMR